MYFKRGVYDGMHIHPIPVLLNELGIPELTTGEDTKRINRLLAERDPLVETPP